MTRRDERIASYQWCYRVAQRSGSSFYRAFWLLERGQRQAMFALYAFARITDDLGDIDGDSEIRRQRLCLWRQSLRTRIPAADRPTPYLELANTEPIDVDGRLVQAAAGDWLAAYDLLWPALGHTVQHYAMPLQLLEELIDGVAMDLKRVRMNDWLDVDGYCYRVASTIGIACTHIWEAHAALPRQPVVDCGLAFQLTNILRDVREDALRDRIYLPHDLLQRFGCDEQSWIALEPHGDWQGLVSSVIERARVLYSSGSKTIDHLPTRGGRMFWLMWSSYRELLEAVDRHKADLWLDRRVRVSRRKRATLLMHSLIASTSSVKLRSPALDGQAS